MSHSSCVLHHRGDVCLSAAEKGLRVQLCASGELGNHFDFEYVEVLSVGAKIELIRVIFPTNQDLITMDTMDESW